MHPRFLLTSLLKKTVVKLFHTTENLDVHLGDILDGRDLDPAPDARAQQVHCAKCGNGHYVAGRIHLHCATGIGFRASNCPPGVISKSTSLRARRSPRIALAYSVE